MPANTAPIFSKFGAIGMGCVLTTAANDFVGNTIHCKEVFGGDDTNGAFIERLRFKSRGTNQATVARIFLNSGGINTSFANTPTSSAPSTATSGGTILAGTYYCKVIAIGPNGSRSVLSAEQTQITTGNASTITWNWGTVAGAVSFEVYVSDTTGVYTRFFPVASGSAITLVQAAMWQTGSYKDQNVGNMQYYGDVYLPLIAASATASTPDIDYFMNLALPPGMEIYVQIATVVTGGWSVCAIGGIY